MQTKAPKHQHLPKNWASQLNGQDSGFNPDSETFRKLYNLEPEWDITCSACCLSYLIGKRSYREIFGGPAPYVKYGKEEKECTDCVLRVPRKGVNGQIWTTPDLNLSMVKIRPFHNSRTYQFYSADPAQLGTLSIGDQVFARLESIAVNVVKDQELSHIQMNYCNGALLELFRQSEKGNPFPGKCYIFVPENRTEDVLVTATQRLALK
eukprot:TRINITY_DN1752_c0_g3_i1.p1 TRINITY_DN1752_c0_g3~~TRINITY_DN1752_c0_g3_i1.p1  ORF type:complete len:208 (+),score=23.45 TRINITY_DN1752_c0_g3_i1:50-673(+)